MGRMGKLQKERHERIGARQDTRSARSELGPYTWKHARNYSLHASRIQVHTQVNDIRHVNVSALALGDFNVNFTYRVYLLVGTCTSTSYHVLLDISSHLHLYLLRMPGIAYAYAYRVSASYLLPLTAHLSTS